MPDTPCICCRQPLEITVRQTCPPCLARTRSAIMETVELYALLPDELEGRAGARKPLNPLGYHTRSDSHDLPGGDVLVLLAHGSTLWRTDEDIDSVAGVLDRWANDWREHLGMTVKLRMQDVTTSTAFLLRALDPMSQQHPTFGEFHADMLKLRDHLRRATRTNPVVDVGVACPYCVTTNGNGNGHKPPRLIRHYADPKPCQHPPGEHRESCDQGGRFDTWLCSGDCGRTYDQAAYNLAIYDHWIRLNQVAALG